MDIAAIEALKDALKKDPHGTTVEEVTMTPEQARAISFASEDEANEQANELTEAFDAAQAPVFGGQEAEAFVLIRIRR
jgi:hypothetical protein